MCLAKKFVVLILSGLLLRWLCRESSCLVSLRGLGASAPWRVWGSVPEAKGKIAVEVVCPLEQPFLCLSGDRDLSEVSLACKSTGSCFFTLERPFLCLSGDCRSVFYKYEIQSDFKVMASRSSSWVLGFSSETSLLVSFDICESLIMNWVDYIKGFVCFVLFTKKRVILRWILGNLDLKLWWILEWLIIMDLTSALWIQRCTRQFWGEDGIGKGT